MVDLFYLKRFITDSNKIEGLTYEPKQREIDAHLTLLAKSVIEVSDLEDFVKEIAPGHRIRSEHGLDVRIGDYLPPSGGPDMPVLLEEILQRANSDMNPFHVHMQYEGLHPFTDGNGRSGRALYYWQSFRLGFSWSVDNLGFLHHWYYQTLKHSNR